MSTKRIRLVVAYDGTDFHGWAAQRGLRTVHGTLTDTVRRISGEENEITGASRTDAGAHARGQVCHFDTERPIDPTAWARILNRALPPDLAVVRSGRVPRRFHSRFCAEDRSYTYRIRTSQRDPRDTRFVHEYGRPLDVDRMRQAAAPLVGTHDFRAYSEELPAGANAVRTLYAVDIVPRDGIVEVRVRGTAFVRGMMRRIAGGLLEVGRGRRDPAELAALLDRAARDRLHRPAVLPAAGLTLERVRYGRPLRDAREARHDDLAGDEPAGEQQR